MLKFTNFISSISNVIPLYIINQLNAAIVNWINNIFYILSENLYIFIIVVVQDFDILTQTL